MEFKLNKSEKQKSDEFEEIHAHKEVNKGAIGGHIQYIITPTAVGDAVAIHCTICGKTKHITDYDTW